MRIMLRMKKNVPHLSLAVVGAGAVGGSLASAFFAAGRIIDAVFDVDEKAGRSIAERTKASWFRALSGAVARSDIVLVAVPDGKIESVAIQASRLRADLSHQVWLHLSGALSPLVLSPLEDRVSGIGAFHPACAFPKGEITRLRPGTCFGVDGSRTALAVAELLAADLKGRAVHIEAAVRPLYPAAVLSSNAVLAAVAEARRVLIDVGVDGAVAESLCVSLATSALQNAEMSGLDAALTGPVARGDTDLIRRHLQSLVQSPSALSVYREMSLSIVRLAREARCADEAALDSIEDLLKSDP